MSSASAPLPSPPRRLRRFACMMYEGVLLFGLLFLAGYLFDTLTQSRHALLHRHSRQAFLFVVMGVYFVMCWRRQGQTLPMKTWHMRVVDQTGHIPPVARLCLRYVLAWLLPLVTAAMVWAAIHLTGWPAMGVFIVCAPFAGFIWSWVDADRLFLHDRLSGTRLVDTAVAVRPG